MSKLSVLISGSGIAGSVFAFWLLRAYPKAHITIVERAPALRLTGASVDIRSSAVDIIKRMNVEQDIRKASTQEKGIQFVGEDGRNIATLGATGKTEVQSITSEYEIMRGTLAKIFITPVLKKLDIIFDEYVERYEQHEDGVTVTFARSKEVKKFDLLIAADGVYSKIRGQMLNTKPADQVHDEGVHVCYFTMKRDLLNGQKMAQWQNATGGRVIFVRPDPNPEGRCSCILMSVTTKADVEMKKKLNDAVRQGNESYKKLMEEQFSDVGNLGPEVLKGIRENDDFYCSLFAQVRSPRYQDGRVVLLGDAACATPGFGTSLAIMGAYLLAGELLNHPGDIKAATKRYEDLMQPFVKGNQGDDNMMQYLNPQTAWGISIRNFVLGTVSILKLDKLATSVAVTLGFKERMLDMPEYKWLEA